MKKLHRLVAASFFAFLIALGLIVNAQVLVQPGANVLNNPTLNNPTVVGQLLLPDGSAAAPSAARAASTGTGIYFIADTVNFSLGGANKFNFTAGVSNIPSTGGYNFANTPNATSSSDSGISRISPNVLAVGNGTQGDFSGTLKATIYNAVTGIQVNGAAAAGQYLIGNGTNFVSLQPALTHSNPVNQTGNATATFKMNGLACGITPVTTGRIIFFITGQLAQTTTADGITVKLAQGTGGAPANAAAATGTVISATLTHTALTGALEVPFSLTASATGFALSTAVWFDLQVANVTGGTASITNVDCTAHEI